MATPSQLEGFIGDYGQLKGSAYLNMCDAITWEGFYPTFRGQCGLKGCKLVLQFTKEEAVESHSLLRRSTMR